MLSRADALEILVLRPPCGQQASNSGTLIRDMGTAAYCMLSACLLVGVILNGRIRLERRGLQSKLHIRFQSLQPGGGTGPAAWGGLVLRQGPVEPRRFLGYAVHAECEPGVGVPGSGGAKDWGPQRSWVPCAWMGGPRRVCSLVSGASCSSTKQVGQAQRAEL